MRITKFIDIQQEIEIDLSVEDLVPIFVDEIDEESKQHILSQINHIYTFMKALPDKFIENLGSNTRGIIHKRMTEQIERFKTTK